MEKLIKSDNGQWTLVKAAPKGVDKDKWDRCVEDVKAEGKAESPHAVCTAAMAKEEDGDNRKNQAQPVVPKKPTEGNKVREKGAGYKMTRGVGDMMQQLHEEGQMKDPPPGEKMKAHLKEAAKVSRIPVSQGKTVKEQEMLAELKDKGRRIKEGAARSKYLSKPEEKQVVIRRKKEDMAKALDGMIYNLNKALEEDHDSEMLFSQLEAIVHHVKEIREVMSPEEDAPDWVDAKITEAAKQLSDVAHYIMGEKAAKK